MRIGKNIDIFTGSFDGVLAIKDTMGENKVTTWLGVIDNPVHKVYVLLFLRIAINKSS